MADIKPFSGYRFAVQNAADLSQLIAPPYDMIGDAAIDALYKQHENNIVRVIQNKKLATDTENKDRHKRAATQLDAWIASGVLAHDAQESVYAYTQDFLPYAGAKKPVRRTAIISLVKLVDYEEGVIKPHEYTHSGPKADRYELLCETKTQSELIFGIVPDKGDLFGVMTACTTGEPDGSFESEGGVHHELRRISDPALIGQLTKAMNSRSILIADGHHRYETCLRYFRETGNPKAGYAVMALVSMADPGLTIRSFHRLFKTAPGSLSVPMHQALAEYFTVKNYGPAKFTTVEAFLSEPANADMLYLDAAEKTFFHLTLNEAGTRYLSENAHNMSSQWNKLNVSTLNSIVVNRVLGLPLDGTVLHDLVDYVNNPLAAYDASVAPDAAQKYRGTFFVKPLSIDTISDIVSGGERMPQKSTNFFPKCFSGLVFYRMTEQK